MFKQLTATILLENAADKIVALESSDTAVATVMKMVKLRCWFGVSIHKKEKG